MFHTDQPIPRFSGFSCNEYLQSVGRNRAWKAMMELNSVQTDVPIMAFGGITFQQLAEILNEADLEERLKSEGNNISGGELIILAQAERESGKGSNFGVLITPEQVEQIKQRIQAIQDQIRQENESGASRGVVIDADWRPESRNSAWVEIYRETSAHNRLTFKQVSSVAECEALLELAEESGTPVKAIIISGTTLVKGADLEQRQLKSIMTKLTALDVTIIINTSTSIEPKAHQELRKIALEYDAYVFDKRSFQDDDFQQAIASAAIKEVS